MTSIKLIVRGAKVHAEVDGFLTSGAVGIPVTIQYDSTWDGLTKNLVCTSGRWGPTGKARTIANIDTMASVAHEVMIADDHLYLGIEGRNAAGNIVFPSIWADCGKIYPGASVNADPSVKPTLPVWAQLEKQINDLKTSGAQTGGNTTNDTPRNDNATAIDYDRYVKAVNHRGYSTVAPENTIPAFILSKKNGFNYVECDVCFSSDGVAVLSHNLTIDACSDGTGRVDAYTYEELLEFDFGSWKSADYAGTKIATFEELLRIGKGLGLHIYIDFKISAQTQIEKIVEMVRNTGMEKNVSYIGGTSVLSYIKAKDPDARLGFLVGSVDEAAITSALNLKTDTNEVFIDTNYANITDEAVRLCVDAGLSLELYTVNDESFIEEMHTYVSGITSDSLIAGKVLYDKYMAYIPPAADNGSGDSGNGGDPGSGGTGSGNGSSGNSGDDSADDSGGDAGTDDDDGIELLHNWDFTKSLADTVSGNTVTLSDSGITQDANGLTLSAANGYAMISNAFGNGLKRTIEIDVAAVDRQGTAHGRFVTIRPATSGGFDSGFIYRNSGKWAVYCGSWSDSTLTDPAALNGKTITIQIIGAGTSADPAAFSVYLDGELLAKSTGFVYTNTDLCIGSPAGSSLYNCTVTGLRIYNSV